MNQVQLFDIEGAGIRFGVTEDGRPYAVASDFAKALDYRDAYNALRLLDSDEKSTQIVSTPGGPQEMSILFEDGMWELIFLSRKPGAKALKKRVKEILREIRQTGSYGSRPVELSRKDLALMVVAAEEDLAVERAKVAELEPKARYVDDFVLDDDLMLLRALVPGVGMTECALRSLLVEHRWIYRKHIGSRWSDSQQTMVDEYEWWPTHYASKQGYFKLRPQHTAPRHHNNQVRQTLYVTTRGAQAVHALVNRHHMRAER